MPCNVARLEALLFEAKSEWAEAERAYTQILEINPFDQVCHIVILMMILVIHVEELVCSSSAICQSPLPVEAIKL